MSKVLQPFLLLIAFAFMLNVASRAGAQRGNRLKSTDASDIDRGQKIYEKNCASCHFAASPEKKIGPGMKGVMKKPKFSNGWRVNDENMRRWIVAGGKNMPPSRLNAEQLRELLAYLKTL